jgi:hypothetical protein
MGFNQIITIYKNNLTICESNSNLQGLETTNAVWLKHSSSGILRGANLELVADISGQPMGLILKGQVVEMGQT